MEQKGHCKHGEFNLQEGCRWCIEEQRATRKILCNNEEGCEHLKGVYCDGENPDCAFLEGQSTDDAPPSVSLTTANSIRTTPIVEIVAGIDNQSALVKVKPETDIQVQQLLGEIMRVKEWADKLIVSNEDSAKAAINDLGAMSKLKKTVEEKRQEYVGPLNAHIKAVNDAFKFLTGPLTEADKMVRDKVGAYKLDQDRRRQEAEEVNRQAVELAQKQAKLNQGEFTVDITPVKVPDAPRLTRTDFATGGMVDNWQYEVEDFNLLPNEYKIPDTAMLTAIAKKHHDTKQVPGVRFFNKPGLRVSSK